MCGKTYPSASALRVHMETHEGPFKCDLCENGKKTECREWNYQKMIQVTIPLVVDCRNISCWSGCGGGASIPLQLLIANFIHFIQVPQFRITSRQKVPQFGNAKVFVKAKRKKPLPTAAAPNKKYYPLVWNYALVYLCTKTLGSVFS